MPGGAAATNDPTESIGARDVVDGVALLADWEVAPAQVFTKLAAALNTMNPPAAARPDEQEAIVTVVADALDLADIWKQQNQG